MRAKPGGERLLAVAELHRAERDVGRVQLPAEPVQPQELGRGDVLPGKEGQRGERRPPRLVQPLHGAGRGRRRVVQLVRKPGREMTHFGNAL